jgi:VWFA-related protein
MVTEGCPIAVESVYCDGGPISGGSDGAVSWFLLLAVAAQWIQIARWRVFCFRREVPMNPAQMFCVVLAFAATSLGAQQRGASPAPLPKHGPVHPGTLTFNVEVTDKAGHPVSGLRQSDFALVDNGVPSQIQAFAAHIPGQASPESTVLVFDAVNMRFGGDSIARNQIMDLLRRHDSRLVYPVSLLMINDTGVQPLGPTADNPQALLATLNREGGQLRDIGRAAGFWGAAEREETAVNSLSFVARAMEKMPGRKLLIWLGPGWPIFDNPAITYSDSQLHSIFSEVVRLSNELTQAQVTLYDVDPLGSWDAGQFRTFIWQGFTKPLQRWDKSLPANLALQVLAVQSGGIVLNSSNDVAGEVNTCAQDGAAWYTISFVPHRAEKPDTWRFVNVKLDKPGLRVRTRLGYYAEP